MQFDKAMWISRKGGRICSSAFISGKPEDICWKTTREPTKVAITNTHSNIILARKYQHSPDTRVHITLIPFKWSSKQAKLSVGVKNQHPFSVTTPLPKGRHYPKSPSVSSVFKLCMSGIVYFSSGFFSSARLGRVQGSFCGADYMGAFILWLLIKLYTQWFVRFSVCIITVQ